VFAVAGIGSHDGVPGDGDVVWNDEEVASKEVVVEEEAVEEFGRPPCCVSPRRNAKRSPRSDQLC